MHRDARLGVQCFFVLVFVLVNWSAVGQNDVKLKIIKDEENNIYKVFFASESDYDVTIKLIRTANGEILVDEKVSGKGFLKSYALKETLPGTYTWKISYGRYSYTEDIKIDAEPVSRKKNPIEVEFDELLNLNLQVEAKKQPPVSVFLYDGAGEQIAYIFWEPDEQNFRKSINFSTYDAYDIKVEILQNGDVIFTDTYSTY